MIEEIKKEILSCKKEILYGQYCEEYLYINQSDIISILDKYKDKEDKYKLAWEELKNYVIDKGSNGYDDSQTMEDCYDWIFKELEQKYNIGSENNG